jgi:hypothetical protein
MKITNDDKLIKLIQTYINLGLSTIRKDSEDWGLGEMWELEVLSSVNRIVVDRIEIKSEIVVYVNIYLNHHNDYYFDLVTEVNYYVGDIIPNIELKENKVIYVNKNTSITEELVRVCGLMNLNESIKLM